MNLKTAIPVIAAVYLASHAAGQKGGHPQNHTAPAARPPQNPKREPQNAQSGKLQQAEPPGSPAALEKLLNLSPEARNKALSSLPPQRRAQIEQKLDEWQKRPPEQRARELARYQLMHSLPAPTKQQVRASLKQLSELPQPRRALVNQQIRRLAPLSDTDRRALMSSEEFRSKFTPAEQQMIADISLITPKN
jgi:mRNA-degrading endonuclease RelE of RelBE toxin-antitoxin system